MYVMIKKTQDRKQHTLTTESVYSIPSAINISTSAHTTTMSVEELEDKEEEIAADTIKTVPRGTGCGRVRGRGSSYSGTVTKHKGLCSSLGIHVFDYGQKGAADQMRTTWEKIVHHVGTIYGHDISNELQNKKTVIIEEPQYTQAILNKHADREARRQTHNLRLGLARQVQKTALEQEVITGTNPQAPMKLALLDNEIEEAAYQMTVDLPIKLDELEANVNHNEWRTYRERTTRLEKQRGQAFSMIRGQCMQVLLDKMKHDANWIPASES
jgi:hypothetical protein